MRKQDSLDDLIINENISSNKNNNTKNILTMIGLVLAVLIGAIFLTKMILEEPEKPKIPVEENLTNTALMQADINESNSSDINESTMQESDDVIVPINDEVNISMSEENIPNEVAPSKIVPAPVAAVKKAINERAYKPLPVKNKADLTQNTKVETISAKKDLNRTDSKSTATELKNTDSKQAQTTGETYYAQVGAFSNKPNDEFISIIKKNGYNYKVVSGKNGSSKILIGPYDGKEKADAALAKIRDRINKLAFLVKQ